MNLVFNVMHDLAPKLHDGKLPFVVHVLKIEGVFCILFAASLNAFSSAYLEIHNFEQVGLRAKGD